MECERMGMEEALGKGKEKVEHFKLEMSHWC